MSKKLSTVDKRIESNKKLLLEQLNRIPIVQIACEKSDISRASYYRWRQEDPEFASLTDEAIESGVSLINDMAESQLIASIKEGNLGALTYWLKHRHKAYSNKLEVTGSIQAVRDALTEEELNLVKEAIELFKDENEIE